MLPEKKFPETHRRVSDLYSHGIEPLGFQCCISLHPTMKKVHVCLQWVMKATAPDPHFILKHSPGQHPMCVVHMAMGHGLLKAMWWVSAGCGARE